MVLVNPMTRYLRFPLCLVEMNDSSNMKCRCTPSKASWNDRKDSYDRIGLNGEGRVPCAQPSLVPSDSFLGLNRGTRLC